MPSPVSFALEPSRLRVLLEHFAAVDDPRDVRRIAFPLVEVLFLVVCATIAGCDDYEHIAAWGRRTWTSCAATCPTRTASPAGAG